MKVGVSKPRDAVPAQFLRDESWLRGYSASEWSVHDLLELSPRIRSQCVRAIRKAEHELVVSVSSSFLFGGRHRLLNDARSEFLEKTTILSEISSELGARAVLLALTEKQLRVDEPMLRQSLRELSQQLQAESIELWIDSGKAAYEIELEGTSVVLDPFWHSTRRIAKGQVFKIHGWHSERWIRYYGQQELVRLARICRTKQPRLVLFAHSQRNEEARTFLATCLPSNP